ncbi:MAG: outer membrane lipoprotein carrier protein LolA [bacterium]
MNICVRVLAVSLAFVGSAFAADLPLLAELQNSLAGATNVQSEFVQMKQLALLQQTVVIKGRLAVQQPDRLSWQVLDPIHYNLVIDGSTLKQWDEESGKVQSMSLAGNPVFKVVVTQLRAWFSGQFDLLTKDFTVETDAASLVPRLIFIPREGSFACKMISRVVLTFREDKRYIQDMIIEERSGDRTSMTFTNTLLNAVVDPVVWEVKPHGR